jgi:4-hydroxy-tetrahydrodipicolinate reductase
MGIAIKYDTGEKNMTKPLKYIQFGAGPIGQKIMAYAAERENIRLDAVIDIDPNKAGVDAGDLIGSSQLGVVVRDDADTVLKNSDAEIVVLSTVSSIEKIKDQVLLCIRHGKNVLSSAEELAFPWHAHPDVSKQIDEAARAADLTVLATGVNPGLVMDTLPITLTGACQKINSIRVERHQDASTRRLPFQQKIGAGLSVDEFKHRVEKKIIRHVGFTESIQMIANCFGWTLDRTEDIVKPVIAETNLESRFFKVSKGQVAGIHQTGRGFTNGTGVIILELEAYLGHPSPKDSVEIDGEPSFYSEVKGGINGDIATCAMVVNAMPKVLITGPGLKTMPEIGTVSWYC